MDRTSRLDELRGDFLNTSTQSMPIAGMLFWAVIAVAGLYLKPVQLACMVGFGSGMIIPLGLPLDALTGRRVKWASRDNPATHRWPYPIVQFPRESE